MPKEYTMERIQTIILGNEEATVEEKMDMDKAYKSLSTLHRTIIAYIGLGMSLSERFPNKNVTRLKDDAYDAYLKALNGE